MTVAVWWLDVGAGVYVLGLVGLALVFGLVVALRRRGRHRDAEALRGLTLHQLLLAARRGLPLEPTLHALARELEERARPAPGPRAFRLFGWLSGWRSLLRRTHRRRASLVFDAAVALREGGLEAAARGLGDAFPAPLPRLLGAAERRGSLLATLEELVARDEAALAFRSAVRAGLLYPACVLLFCFWPWSFYQSVIAPKFAEIMRSTGGSPAGVDLLASVQGVLGFAAPAFFVGAWLAAGLLAPGGGPLRRGLRRGLPWVRGAAALAERARLCRLVAAYVRAGVPAAEALRELAALGAADDARLEEAARRAAEGADVASALAGAGLLAGEPVPAPEPEVALRLLAAEHEDRYRARLDGAARLATPLGVLVVGAVVATCYWTPFLYADEMRRGLW